LFKKIIILVSIFFTFLGASDECYTIELWSVHKSKYKKGIEEIKYLDENRECKIFYIGNYYTMRCGCYNSISDIKDLNKYKKQFKNAYVRTTLKSRFVKKIVSSKIVPSKIISKENSYIDLSSITLLPKISDKNIIHKTDMEKDISRYKKSIEQQFHQIKNRSNIVGFGIEGRYDQYINQNYLDREYTDYEFNVKIKYDIFKDGYYQHEKELKKTYNFIKILEYKNLINLHKYNYDDNIEKLDYILSKINVLYYDNLVKIYDDAIKRYNKLLDIGSVSKYEVDILIHKKNNFKALKNSYKKKNDILVDENIYKLLLYIEDFKLVNIDSIKAIANEQNLDINLEVVKSRFLDVDASFYDDVSLSVFSSVRSMDEVGWYNTFGAQVDIPLNYTSQETKELNKLQKESIKYKKKVIKQFVYNSFGRLYSSFDQLQLLIDTDKKFIYDLSKELDDYKIISKYNIPNLHIDYNAKILSTQSDILDSKYDILLKKIELLKIILKISYLSNIADIKKIVLEKK